MNRRHFIHTLMLTAGAASSAGSQIWNREPRALGLAYRHQPKLQLPLVLSCAEEELGEVFAMGSKSLHLFGGPVLARTAGKDTSWMNFLIDCPDFPRLKRKLFEFGVRPISTPEMPGTFIKFSFQEKIYNVMNCDVDQFCQRNRLQAKVKLVPFAHNFLIYDCNKQELADPCNAFGARGKDRRPKIVLISRPRSLAEGFDCVLSGRFESALLGFQPSDELRDFDEYILNSTCPAHEVPRIVERTINYMPDAIEILGEEKAAHIALSPLVQGVLKGTLGVDIEKVWSGLWKEAPEDRTMAFLGLIKEEMGMDRGAAGFEDRLTLYLATNGYALRRSDLAMDVVMNA